MSGVTLGSIALDVVRRRRASLVGELVQNVEALHRARRRRTRAERDASLPRMLRATAEISRLEPAIAQACRQLDELDAATGALEQRSRPRLRVLRGGRPDA